MVRPPKAKKAGPADMPYRLNHRHPDFERAFDAFLNVERGDNARIDAVVDKIIADIRRHGFDALARYTKELDGFALDLDNAQLTQAEIEQAKNDCPSDVQAAIALAGERIAAYHRRALPQDAHFVDDAGIGLGWRWSAIEAVGLYVPGGRAAYPSSVLMNAIPARIAGVKRLAMVTPASAAPISPAVLCAAHHAGVTEIWRIGGAQAIAALAYGCGPIECVDKIVGPGNAYVAAAKKAVFGRVGIDAIAGPSEVVILADANNSPEILAADLLAQAEHDPDAQSVLIADDGAFLDAVDAALRRQIPLSGASAAASWERNGALIEVQDLASEGVALVNRLAPEHVQLALDQDFARTLSAQILHAGAIFIGRHAGEALGDYVTGSNHVLPTSRAARFSSGLSTSDFMKRTSLQTVDARGLAQIGPAAVTLAHAEGLPAHARSIALRLVADPSS